MEVEDIRLTPEEIDDARADGVGSWIAKNKRYTTPRMVSRFIASDMSKQLIDIAIASAATDKAIKKIDELLIFCKRAVGGINPEWAICDRNYQELKKLLEAVSPSMVGE
uniref:Uncharacterized protein n=1 Tax=viral metagenome TaxID=1070528 RepID=A0A6M3LRY1_9ZZZZ